MDIQKRKQYTALFELALLFIWVFSVSYNIHLNDSSFEAYDAEYKKNVALKLEKIDAAKEKFFDALKKPMIPTVEAAEEEVAGCCSLASNNEQCVTSSNLNCPDTSQFAEGALCSETSFCQRGCCFNEALGIFDSNVLQTSCPAGFDWTDDASCNLPAADLGCCVLGSETIFETRGQCEVDTRARALGESSIVDWRADVGESACIALSLTQREGACVLNDNICHFGTESYCISVSGSFNPGLLCTANSLGTDCEPTAQTMCVEGKDQVYFVDTCGNPANVYDSSRVNDDSYWNEVVSLEESCNAGDSNGGANSATCGNCDRFNGGICRSALDDGFDVEWGNYYCKQTACTFLGEEYENGESWCSYDGKVGDGDDVVGSRHFKYVCNQGTVDIEPCADYRNQICVQTNEFEVDGVVTEFKNAACIANNWRECININYEENATIATRQCEAALNCDVRHINVDKKFDFNVCTPSYPPGFSFTDQRYTSSAEAVCKTASGTCTVVRVPKFTGGCKYKYNKDCLREEFTQQMNDYCRALGDCGLEANIAGEYTKNYNIEISRGSQSPPDLSSDWIEYIVGLSNPVEGNYAPVENYEDYISASGLFGGAGPAPDAGEPVDVAGPINQIGMGLAGVGFAAGVVAQVAVGIPLVSAVSSFTTGVSVVAVGSSSFAGLAAFSGVAIGVAIGFLAGAYLAQALGLSPLGTILMSIGGAILGGIAVVAYLGLANVWNPVGWVLIIVAILLILIALIFGGDSCKAIDVEFECKPWQPPAGGGTTCEICNDDPLRPCSEYRCRSLGAACNLLNKGTDNELCIDENPNDVTPPVIEFNENVIDGAIGTNVGSGGFTLEGEGGGCLDSNTPITLGITTDEPSICKYDFEENPFEEMRFDLGGNYYTYNHTHVIGLPDPSHGESQGLNWTGDLTMYIKCRDTHGIETPGYYAIDVCVYQGPDRRAPLVVATEPRNNRFVSFDQTSEDVRFITNELSTCRWSSSDVDYSLMGGSMFCNDTLFDPSSTLGYSCNATLPITTTGVNTYFVRCGDQPWLDEPNVTSNDTRNFNQESFVYTMTKPSQKISITGVSPNEDFKTATDFTSIELSIATSGGGETHFCSYSFTGYENMIELLETGANRIHKQPLNLPAGEKNIFVECRDETGDFDRSEASFEIIHDTTTPQVARVWQSGGTMYVVTTEVAECKYSTEACLFDWDSAITAGSGTLHSFTVEHGQTYFVKCEDEFGNVPSQCSIQATAL